VRARDGDRELALSGYLDVLRDRRLRPLFTEVADPIPYARRGLDTHPYADAAVLDLAGFDLAAGPLAGLRRDIIAARDRLVLLPYRPVHSRAVAAFAPSALADTALEAWVALDPAGAVQGVAAWTIDLGGADPDRSRADQPREARTLRLAAAHPLAPAQTLELLIADAAAEYRDRGVTGLHLGWRARAPWWPTPASTGGEVRAAVERFGPQWQPRWLALPSAWQLPAAAGVLRAETGECRQVLWPRLSS
jgi:hypothetical protein